MNGPTAKVEAEFLQVGETVLMDGSAAKVLDIRGPWDGELSLTYSTSGIVIEQMIHPRETVELLDAI